MVHQGSVPGGPGGVISISMTAASMRGTLWCTAVACAASVHVVLCSHSPARDRQHPAGTAMVRAGAKSRVMDRLDVTVAASAGGDRSRSGPFRRVSPLTSSPARSVRAPPITETSDGCARRSSAREAVDWRSWRGAARVLMCWASTARWYQESASAWSCLCPPLRRRRQPEPGSRLRSLPCRGKSGVNPMRPATNTSAYFVCLTSLVAGQRLGLPCHEV